MPKYNNKYTNKTPECKCIAWVSYSVRVRLCARVCLCVRAAEAAAEVKTLDFAFFLFICSALRLAFVAERSENHKCAHGARQKVSWQEPGLPKRKWLVRPWNGKGMVGSGWLGPGLLSSFPSANGGGREKAEGDVLYFLKMSSKIWTLYPGNGSCSICKEVTQGAGSTAPARPPSTKHSVDMDMNVDLDGLIKAGKQQRQETRTTTKRGRAPGHRWNVHTSETGHTQHRRKSCSNAANSKY